MDNILSALTVMVVGMGFVFFFLVIQVLITKLFARIGQKYAYLFPEPAAPKPKAPAKSTGADDTETAAAVVAALLQAGKMPR